MKSNAIQSNLICPTQFIPACLNKSIYYVQFLEANKLDINTISATLYREFQLRTTSTHEFHSLDAAIF